MKEIQWEYDVTYLDFTEDDPIYGKGDELIKHIARLNLTGKKGWELVQVLHPGGQSMAFYWKRPRREN